MLSKNLQRWGGGMALGSVAAFWFVVQVVPTDLLTLLPEPDVSEELLGTELLVATTNAPDRSGFESMRVSAPPAEIVVSDAGSGGLYGMNFEDHEPPYRFVAYAEPDVEDPIVYDESETYLSENAEVLYPEVTYSNPSTLSSTGGDLVGKYGFESATESYHPYTGVSLTDPSTRTNKSEAYGEYSKEIPPYDGVSFGES
ncbi:hypothetical protein N9V92_06790 [Luminiphilus sp.]|nr:hypothetical protein [Luminiphilus sp.]MDB2352879.1 hypothetical protein [Luminiphilus sp.]